MPPTKAPTVSKELPEKEERQEPQAKPRSEQSKNLVENLYTGVAEKTFQESPYWDASQRKPYNPDDLVQKSGDYRIYEEMMHDDQVDVCLQIKRDLVVGSGWDIVPGVTDGSQEEIEKDVEAALGEDPDVCIDELIEEIISAYGYGFSLSEVLFKYRDDGTLTLRNIKTRHPSSWEIHTDTQGNVEKYLQHGPKGDIEVDPKSLIHYVNGRRFGNPYGRSDLRVAYNAWFVKRQVVKWYAIFLEKHASPTTVAQYDKNAPQTAVDSIFASIKTLQQKTAMAIPKEILLTFLESKSNGEAYAKAMGIFNMFIGRALMIPDLLGFQGGETGGGAYSLGKEQFKLLFLHIMRRRSNIERIVNRQIVLPIVVHNHGFVESPPKFMLRPIDDELVQSLAKLWLECVKGKTYKPSDEEINHFRSIVKFPQGDVEREAPPVQVGPDGEPIGGDGGEGGPDNVADASGDKGAAKGNAKEGGAKGGDDGGAEAGAAKEEKDEKKQFDLKVYKALPGGYDKKVDYKAIESSMDRFKGRVLDETLPIVRRVYENLYEQIKAKKILQTQNVDKLEELKPKYLTELRLILKSSLREGFKEGKAVGHREILKGAFRAPLPDEKFLEFIESETFQYVGDWSFKVNQKMRVKLLEAIRDGKPLSSVIDFLDEEGVAESMGSIERYARTKFTDVMNRGRMAAFNDSGVVAAYQYSSILDDRVTDICAGLSGKIFKNGTEPIPPMHWNALLEGSRVRTMFGDRPIEELHVGERVLTHLGNWARIYDVMTKFEDKEYFEIELEDGKVLRATGEHPVLTRRGWVRADELNESDDVVRLEDIRSVRKAFHASLVDSENGIAALL